jgi:hypothetical protein
LKSVGTLKAGVFAPISGTGGSCPPLTPIMFKFALALGIIAEWITGPVVASAPSFGLAVARTFMATLVAWMALEAARAVVRAVQTLDDRA